MRDAQVVPGQVADVDAVERDAAAVELVEPHDEVDERRLAGAGRPDDGDGLTGAHRQVEVLDERLVGRVGEGHVLERRRAPCGSSMRAGSAASGSCSSASSTSKTRSAEATPDWSTLAIEATWVSGWVNWREYWMNAWTSPRLIVPRRHPEAADDGDDDVVEVPDEHHGRHDDAADELGAERGLVELVVLLLERPLRSPSGGRRP